MNFWVSTAFFGRVNKELTKGKLNRPGQIRVDKIYALSQTIVVKTFGRVNVDTLNHEFTEKSHELHEFSQILVE